MNELRKDLDDTAAEAGFYLDAEGAIRGADRQRRRFRLALVPVVAVVVGAASLGYAGLSGTDTADDPPVAAPGTFGSLGADVLDDAGGVVHVTDGSTVRLPDSTAPWDDGAKIPAGWIIHSPNELRVLYPDGRSELLDERVAHYTVSRDGGRIAWRAEGSYRIEWAALGDGRIEDRGGYTPEDGFTPDPVAWAGDEIVLKMPDMMEMFWTTWLPGSEPPTDWRQEHPGLLLGVNARDELLFTFTATRRDWLTCQVLLGTGIGPDGLVTYGCWQVKGTWGSVSPDGTWLTLGGGGFLDLTVPPDTRITDADPRDEDVTGQEWPTTANCGDDQDTATWVAADATVVERAGVWYRCTVTGGESQAVPVHPTGKVLPVYGV